MTISNIIINLITLTHSITSYFHSPTRGVVRKHCFHHGRSAFNQYPSDRAQLGFCVPTHTCPTSHLQPTAFGVSQGGLWEGMCVQVVQLAEFVL